MLFYSSLVTTLIALIPLLIYWKDVAIPRIEDIFYLLLLGGGSNFILYCLLKALKLVQASSIAPFRYLELLFSIIMGYIVFNELPSYHVYIGALIIIPCSFYIALKEKKESNV